MGKTKRPPHALPFPESAGASEKVATFRPGDVIFAQGDACDAVMYLEDGSVKLSVLSPRGKEGVVALVRPGDFFGEGCLAGRPRRFGTAIAIAPSRVAIIDKRRMLELLRAEPTVSDRFITHMVSRNIRGQQNLIDLFFNSSEKRLARALLLLAQLTPDETTPATLPKISQGTLAEMVGTTRSRVNFFMKKFKRLGFIDYSGTDQGGLRINPSLLSVLQD